MQHRNQSDILNAVCTAVLIQIEMCCHNRWLGDLYLPDIALQEWWHQLEELGKSVKETLKKSQTSNADY
jgi:hypothetical protein